MQCFYLAHSAIPAKGDAANYLTGTENFSVLTSQGVASCVASLLIGLPASTCGLYGAASYGIVSDPFHSTGTELALFETDSFIPGQPLLDIGAVPLLRSAFGHQARSNLGYFLHLGQKTTPLVAQAVPQNSRQEGVSPIPLPSETPEEAAQRMRLQPTIADTRLSVTPPQGDVPLGNPVDIDVMFTRGTLAGLHVTQFQPHDGVRGGIEGSTDAFTITKEAGQTKTLEVIPLRLGTVTLEIGAVYSDNAMAQKTVKLNVVPSSKNLKTFSLNKTPNSTMAMALEDEEKDREQWLYPTVAYNGVASPIYLTDSSSIALTLEQDNDSPAISIDKNGLVHAMHEGTAIITGNFDGALDKVKVIVYGKDDAPPGYIHPTH